VSKIRGRFAAERLGALHDAPRSGRKPKYDAATEARVLAALDAPRPKGWLVAEHLGDVKAHHVWRVLRRRGVCLERRHSSCVSTDPEFERNAADIVRLYLEPPSTNAPATARARFSRRSMSPAGRSKRGTINAAGARSSWTA
jgi:hypothetical protein